MFMFIFQVLLAVLLTKFARELISSIHSLSLVMHPTGNKQTVTITHKNKKRLEKANSTLKPNNEFL